MSNLPQTPPNPPLQFACCRVGGPEANRLIAGSMAPTWGFAVVMMHKHPLCRVVTVPASADLRSNPVWSEIEPGLIDCVTDGLADLRKMGHVPPNALLVDRVTALSLLNEAANSAALAVGDPAAERWAMRGEQTLFGLRLIPIDLRADSPPQLRPAFVFDLDPRTNANLAASA